MTYQHDSGEGVDENGLTLPRLSKEEEQKLVNRLYYRQLELSARSEKERQEKLEQMTFKGHKVSSQKEDTLVRRMYDIQVERFRMGREERDRRVHDETHKNDRTLTQAEIEDQVSRMYDQQLARERATKKELQTRYLPEVEPKKLPPSYIKETVDRLHYVDWAKRDEELFKKHVYPYDPKKRKISRSDVEAMANRLSTRGGS